MLKLFHLKKLSKTWENMTVQYLFLINLLWDLEALEMTTLAVQSLKLPSAIPHFQKGKWKNPPVLTDAGRSGWVCLRKNVRGTHDCTHTQKEGVLILQHFDAKFCFFTIANQIPLTLLYVVLVSSWNAILSKCLGSDKLWAGFVSNNHHSTASPNMNFCNSLVLKSMNHVMLKDAQQFYNVCMQKSLFWLYFLIRMFKLQTSRTLLRICPAPKKGQAEDAREKAVVES